ncbi:MAG: hypothetical protein P8Q37_00025 [Porticoccaceae bacterium]|nr:hypothetical protein [Porticoccaceae bacterium]MDG1473262.1 hypothetical protein [Porticoccaceae bacterium]
MTEEKSINIDSRKLFNLGVNLLVAGFVRQKPEDTKKLFKDLKQGNIVQSGQLTSEQNNMVIPVKLQLDRSEYKGQFNFPNFEIAVKTMLQKFETEVRKDKDLKDLHTLTNDKTGGLLFNLPTGIKIGNDINVLMMAVEPMEECLVVKLLFMDPAQFEA